MNDKQRLRKVKKIIDDFSNMEYDINCIIFSKLVRKAERLLKDV